MGKSFREKIIHWFDSRDKKTDKMNWTTENKEPDASSIYYFRDVIH